MENSQFAVVEFGGAIGLKRENKINVSGYGTGYIIETYASKDEAKVRTKFWNKSRTPAEKDYYGYKYKTVKLKQEAPNTI